MMTMPLRQSFVRRQLAAHGASFAEAGSGVVALSFGGSDELAVARQLGLADLSPWPRTGFKGRNTLPALRAQGVALEDRPNQAFRQSGGLAAVLAMTEVLLLAPLAEDAAQVKALTEGWSLDELAVARQLGLADLSPWPRTGFKGRDVLPALRAQGVALEDRPNQAFRQSGGGLAAVLALTEVLLLAPLAEDAAQVKALTEGWSLDHAAGCYLAPRQDSHFWFRITGVHASEMFAKLCGVDLRVAHFSDLAIAQTSVARSNAIVIRDDLGATPAFHLLGDSASAAYMWDCVLDAMAEFEGAPVGLEVLRAL